MMLFTPLLSSFLNISESSYTVISRPKPSRLIFLFWQKTHLKLQPEKNIAPEPLSPLIQGSSQKWVITLATTGFSETRQKPARDRRETPHRLGQAKQGSVFKDEKIKSFIFFRWPLINSLYPMIFYRQTFVRGALNRYPRRRYCRWQDRRPGRCRSCPLKCRAWRRGRWFCFRKVLKREPRTPGCC